MADFNLKEKLTTEQQCCINKTLCFNAVRVTVFYGFHHQYGVCVPQRATWKDFALLKIYVVKNSSCGCHKELFQSDTNLLKFSLVVVIYYIYVDSVIINTILT